MLVLQDLDDDTDIHAARTGIQLFGCASRASYERVRPDGIVPGPRSSGPRSSGPRSTEPSMPMLKPRTKHECQVSESR
jgi:hypothetical protein